MAINLWKINGLATNYYPLSASTTNQILSKSFSFDTVYRFKAKSASGGTLRVTNQGIGSKDFVLTPVLTSYEWVVGTIASQFYLRELTAFNDVWVQDIELVQKPLPKLTINGISGEVADWEQGTIDGNNGNVVSFQRIRTKVNVPLVQGQQYTISCASGYEILAFKGVTSTIYGKQITFTADGTTGRIVIRKPDNSNLVPSDVSNALPSINLGAIPAPYSKKTGDKMVMPVAKKNLFNKDTVTTGKYVSDGNGTLIDSGAGNTASDFIAVSPSKQYAVSGITKTLQISANVVRCAWYDINKTFIVGQTVTSNGATITSVPNARYIRITVHTDDLGTAQLEEGTTATPYTPYAVQVNKKPQKWVPKKNLVPMFDKWVLASNMTVSNGVLFINSVSSVSANISFDAKPNTTYAISNIRTNLHSYSFKYFDASGIQIGSTSYLPYTAQTITTPNNCFKVTIGIYKDAGADLPVTISNFQVEEGSQSTSYEPFQLVLPKAKTGVSFNGVTDYLQLPSMTLDSIEIECLIDAVQDSGDFLIDARNGLANGYVWNGSGSFGSAWTDFRVNGVSTGKSFSNIPTNIRTKLYLSAGVPFTDDVTIFAKNDSFSRLKAILYKVTCYLSGQIVAQYDFENPCNIVGNQVIPNAVNLIPSFEDSRWSLHANAKVMGKDVLHLDATAQWQNSVVTLQNLKGSNYYFSADGKGTVEFWKNGAYYTNGSPPIKNKLLILSDNDNLEIRFFGGSAGSFDFIRPQLYQISGKEGTINGTPKPQIKAPKRLLYSKR